MQADKIEAIYALREAAEQKGAAEATLQRETSPAARDALLDAQVRLESKTLAAIEACHQCGHEHAPDEPHGERGRSNVIDVNFNRDETS